MTVLTNKHSANMKMFVEMLGCFQGRSVGGIPLIEEGKTDQLGKMYGAPFVTTAPTVPMTCAVIRPPMQ